MQRRAYYVTIYSTNHTHGPFADKSTADAYAASRGGSVSTLSGHEIALMKVRIYAPRTKFQGRA